MSVAQKSAGCIIGCMAGDALGACVEGWPSNRIESFFPKGLRDLQNHPRGFGRYTDDTQMTLALARSLVVYNGKVDPGQVAKAYAADYDPARGYGGSTHKVLRALKTTDADWRTLVPKFKGEGSQGNGAPMRISPVGVAYRNAPPAVLHKAVTDACVSTHTHPTAIDGAFVLAAAVGWLMNQEPASTLARARELQASLLNHLGALAHTEGMQQKLKHLSCHLGPPLEMVTGKFWEGHLGSGAWLTECQLQLELSEGQWFQIKADSAVAASLCAFLHHGLICQGQAHPENALIAAVHYGGDTDTVAAMAGACVGALHGYDALPERWVKGLENGVLGRDEALRYAQGLARLDVRG